MPTLIDTSTLTKIGNMTSGGGVSAAVNPSDSGSTGYYTNSGGWAGVTLGTPTKIHSVDVISATNGFDASGSTTTINLKLYGKTGSAPANGTDGTLLGTTGNFTDVNTTTTKTITSTDTTTSYDHVWVYVTTGVWTVFEAVKPYAVDAASNPSYPTLGTGVAIVKKNVRTALPMTRAGAENPAYRIGFYIADDRKVTILFNTDYTHIGGSHNPSYTGVLSVGAVVQRRYSTTEAGLFTASFSSIATLQGGQNIYDETDHYGHTSINDAMLLSAGWHEFSVFVRAATSSNNYDNLAECHEDYNCLQVIVHPLVGTELHDQTAV